MTPAERSAMNRRNSMNSPWRRQNACQTHNAIQSAKRIRERELDGLGITHTPTPDAPEPMEEA